MLRTLFLDFENGDWERELKAFKTTDIRVPATLAIDGRAYRHVGVQFHGNSSFSSVSIGWKHCIHITTDFIDSARGIDAPTKPSPSAPAAADQAAGSTELDPMAAAGDSPKPLAARLLAVPALLERERLARRRAK